MKRMVELLTIAAATLMTTAPAFAGPITQVPEPVSMSLLAGGIVAIAAVKHLRK
jgi:hypothetical protein